MKHQAEFPPIFLSSAAACMIAALRVYKLFTLTNLHPTSVNNTAYLLLTILFKVVQYKSPLVINPRKLNPARSFLKITIFHVSIFNNISVKTKILTVR